MGTPGPAPRPGPRVSVPTSRPFTASTRDFPPPPFRLLFPPFLLPCPSPLVSLLRTLGPEATRPVFVGSLSGLSTSLFHKVSPRRPCTESLKRMYVLRGSSSRGLKRTFPSLPNSSRSPRRHRALCRSPHSADPPLTHPWGASGRETIRTHSVRLERNIRMQPRRGSVFRNGRCPTTRLRLSEEVWLTVTWLSVRMVVGSWKVPKGSKHPTRGSRPDL